MTGLEIYKLLPKTNCKKCGFPTCLAFAIALAGKKVELDKCPDVDDSVRQVLGEATVLPVRAIRFGRPGRELEIGGETEMFRHGKRFNNATVLAVTLSDKLSADAQMDRLDRIAALRFDRLGEMLGVEAVAVVNDSGSAEAFAAACELVSKESDLAGVLLTNDPECARAGLDACKGAGKALRLCSGQALVVGAFSSDEDQDAVIFLEDGGLADVVSSATSLRRRAIEGKDRSAGFPIAVRVMDSPLKAAGAICKYASLLILDSDDPAELLPLVTLRLNIYTDPQKPVIVDPGVYEVGNPTPDSPVIVTTNFSLTYHSVRPEIESSKVPAWLLIVDTEGQSVLTAWAADKLNGKAIAKAITDSGIEERVKDRTMIIPGLVAIIKGETEDETGWRVEVGPREASALPKYLRNLPACPELVEGSG